ncbi:MAG: type I methionyl aminopeptidase [Terriglobales bacterium]
MIIEKKSAAQIVLMRKAGLVVWEAHQAAASLVKAGTTTAEIDAVVEKVIRDHHAEPLFKGHKVQGAPPFPACACVSVNEEIVHGIPGPRKLKDGDIVSVDIGVRYQGWCGDAAVTWPVGEISAEAKKLLEICEGTLRLAIRKMKANIVWNKVARVMESNVKNAGFAVVEDLCGHGIGQQMWESPQVPNYFSPFSGDFKLQAGMVVAIEPMVAVGTKALRVLDDHWTYVTADGSLAAHFEHTIAITEDGVTVLTCGPDGQGWGMG